MSQLSGLSDNKKWLQGRQISASWDLSYEGPGMGYLTQVVVLLMDMWYVSVCSSFKEHEAAVPLPFTAVCSIHHSFIVSKERRYQPLAAMALLVALIGVIAATPKPTSQNVQCDKLVLWTIKCDILIFFKLDLWFEFFLRLYERSWTISVYGHNLVFIFSNRVDIILISLWSILMLF